MNIDNMRTAIALDESITKLVETHKRLKKIDRVRISPALFDGQGMGQDLYVPSKAIARLFAAEITRLRTELKAALGE